MDNLTISIIAFAIFMWLIERRIKNKKNGFYKKKDSDNSSEDNYIKYSNLNDWEADLKVLWNGKPFEIEFTYESKKGKTRRSVTLKKVVTNSRNELYLIGKCHTRNEERTFNMENIVTLIKHKNKRYHHFDFINDVVGINPSGYTFFC